MNVINVHGEKVKNVFSSSKYCPTLLETVGLRVPNRNFRD